MDPIWDWRDLNLKLKVLKIVWNWWFLVMKKKMNTVIRRSDVVLLEEMEMDELKVKVDLVSKSRWNETKKEIEVFGSREVGRLLE